MSVEKITIVHVGDFLGYPPVISLIENLLNKNIKVSVISSSEFTKIPNKIICSDLFQYIYTPYNSNKGVFPKLIRFFSDRRKLRIAVENSMKDSDILWTTTDVAIKILGNQLMKYKHIMQLMELVQRQPLFFKSRYYDFPIAHYARAAYKVVVPDLDRAYIQQAWWDLKVVPTVLPNKPYSIVSENLSTETLRALEIMGNEKRKILFYAGYISSERNIVDFARAVSKRSDYCLYMIGQSDPHDDELNKLLQENNVVYLGNHQAPAHLEFFKYAHIGLTPYLPARSNNHPEINALYCAPNKVYEYSAFGVPMIGTNVLGLLRPFEQYGIGRCAKEMTVPEILKCIDYIDAHYEEMSQNCLDFFAKDDLDEIVKEIIEE
ncbi:glycosyltransferase [Streptococcus ruminantium]|uniref:glycosyltransferase n=1 Tax=Streptococcus ruminantium TaxID=1917441 RepID=UPI0012DEBD38|nr:glycosyltransferase [Streptococcus ruminantium]